MIGTPKNKSKYNWIIGEYFSFVEKLHPSCCLFSVFEKAIYQFL